MARLSWAEWRGYISRWYTSEWSLTYAWHTATSLICLVMSHQAKLQTEILDDKLIKFTNSLIILIFV